MKKNRLSVFLSSALFLLTFAHPTYAAKLLLQEEQTDSLVLALAQIGIEYSTDHGLAIEEFTCKIVGFSLRMGVPQTALCQWKQDKQSKSKAVNLTEIAFSILYRTFGPSLLEKPKAVSCNLRESRSCTIEVEGELEKVTDFETNTASEAFAELSLRAEFRQCLETAKFELLGPNDEFESASFSTKSSDHGTQDTYAFRVSRARFAPGIGIVQALLQELTVTVQTSDSMQNHTRYFNCSQRYIE